LKVVFKSKLIKPELKLVIEFNKITTVSMPYEAHLVRRVSVGQEIAPRV
jgi:hypothetical protein